MATTRSGQKMLLSNQDLYPSLQALGVVTIFDPHSFFIRLFSPSLHAFLSY